MNTDFSNVMYATAVPVPVEPTIAVAGSLERNPSSYRLPQSSLRCIQQHQIQQLKQQGFTSGLAKALSNAKAYFPLRIWVLDNSGSMHKADGHRIVETTLNRDVKFIDCTRWEELHECVNYHIQLAALLEAPTTFRLLNDPGVLAGSQQFGVAEMGDDQISNEVQTARDIVRKTSPSGVTPLTRHIEEIQVAVRSMAADLNQRGQRVALVIATDGLPTDAEGMAGKFEQSRFVEALRSLERLPVWVVIRLCTNEEDVVEFYNSLDEQLELSMEVLDDFVEEAQEVHGHNPWLNYALPLHRMREFGFHDRIFDMLDERALTEGELREFCVFLFGVDNLDGFPDPGANWPGFIQEVDRLANQEGPQWNPIKKKVTPWIDVKKLDKIYGDGTKCTIM